MHYIRNLHHYPIRLLTASLLLTACICTWLGWNVYYGYEIFDNGQSRLIRQEQLHGTILQLDEVLTMSARMAAASGDLQWDARYYRFAPQLDAAIAEAKQLAPATSMSAAQTDAANQKLVALEEQAFALVRVGQQNQAQLLLASPEYETQKQRYASGMAQLTAESRTQLAQTIQHEKERALQTLGASVVLIIVGLLTALALLRRKLVQPLQRLAYATTAITTGTWSGELQISSQDVIGILQRAFNQMARTLQQQIDRLREQASAAEAARQVAERAQTQMAAQLVTIQEQQTVIREQSVPILPLTGSTVVMPLVGALDAARLRLVQEQALKALQRASVRHLIVDITGVPVIDTQVAQGLLQVMQAARLLGTTVILVGIRPEVAQTIVSLGIDMSAIITQSTLSDGIAYALQSSP